MPPTRSKKLKERLELALRIEELGHEMSPCSFCKRNNLKCVVANNSTRCGECACRGSRCNVEGFPVGDWESLKREEERLRRERDSAFQLAKDSLARVERLEKQ
jgi:hypothetical protein